MTIGEFNRLSEDKQRTTILYDGVLQATRTTKNYVVALFQLEAFYVEIWRFENKSDKGLIIAFESMDLLDPYLSDINITMLVEH